MYSPLTCWTNLICYPWWVSKIFTLLLWKKFWSSKVKKMFLNEFLAKFSIFILTQAGWLRYSADWLWSTLLRLLLDFRKRLVVANRNRTWVLRMRAKGHTAALIHTLCNPISHNQKRNSCIYDNKPGYYEECSTDSSSTTFALFFLLT